MKPNALIVDDEFLARENLAMMIESYCPEVNVIGQADSARNAILSIKELQPDIIFLDIRMPSGSEGFEVLEAPESRECRIIFVTAFKDYAIKAFKANAIDYLLKPVDPEELKEAVSKVVDQIKKSSNSEEGGIESRKIIEEIAEDLKLERAPSKITVRHSKGFKVFEIQSINRLEASGNCTWIYFKDGSSYFDTRTLGVYEDILPKQQFMRVHKSHIINLSEVTEYQSDSGALVVLSSGDQIPVSRSRLTEFLNAFRNK